MSYDLYAAKIVLKTKRANDEFCCAIRKWAPGGVFGRAITSIAFPIFLYSIEVWYPPYFKNQQQLERMMKFAARLLTNIFSHVDNEELIGKLKWNRLYHIVAEQCLLTVTKYLNCLRFPTSKVFAMAMPLQSRCNQNLLSPTQLLNSTFLKMK
jgi:hypothetical protein